MRVALAQLNPTVGDVAGNVRRVEEVLRQVQPESPDLVVFPELCITGYPPQDLLERGWFIESAIKGLAAVVRISERFAETGILVGAVVETKHPGGRGVHNAAVLVERGREVGRQAKSLLPTYDVFDELRYFEPAAGVKPVRFRGELLGVTVCEDAWNGPEWTGPRKYETDPVALLARAGAALLVNMAASPFSIGKDAVRYKLLAAHAVRHRLPFVFVNQVGGNDELVFDGTSMALDSHGNPVRVAGSFVEDTVLVDTSESGRPDGFRPAEPIASVYQALVLGVRDYASKTGFSRAVLGLSGGIDSAVAGCIAVAALGRENVLGITMPSEYSSEGSVRDSEVLARNLGIRLEKMPIADVCRVYGEVLRECFAGRPADVTEENIQARVRGNLLMAVSNKLGYLVIATGNKSELAVGYCTLYGDMSGGLGVLADVPKTMVYEIARYVNRERDTIPEAIIEKEPSAELKPGQKDQDTLPPYEILDRILAQYVEGGRSVDEIVAAGLARDTVERVVALVDRSEYKRFQAAPGIRVTSKAFGIGRRMPLAARYRARSGLD